MEQGGGFVPIEVAAGGAPIFTLYGDGRVVFQQLRRRSPRPAPTASPAASRGGPPSSTRARSEELLTFALGQGGLGTARDNYADATTIDAGNTIFSIDAGGVDKTVTVTALGMEPTGGPDDADRASFAKLAERLRDFDEGGTISTDVYAPTGLPRRSSSRPRSIRPSPRRARSRGHGPTSRSTTSRSATASPARRSRTRR